MKVLFNKKFIVKTVCFVLITVLLFSFMGCNGTSTKKSSNTDEKQKTEYSVTYTQNQGGTVSAVSTHINDDYTSVSTENPSSVVLGDDIVFTVKCDEGYFIDEFIINNGVVSLNKDNTYTISGVLCDLNVSVTYYGANTTINYDVGDGEKIDSKYGVAGEYFGDELLPTPLCTGKRFVKWVDDDQNEVQSSSTIPAGGSVTIHAVYSDITSSERSKLTPFSITTAYYDSAATKYGVVFHTKVEPIYPVILYTKTNGNQNVDFANATVAICDYEGFLSEEEYCVSGVVDNLEYNTEYAVKMGDISAGVFSNTYIFTTRNEVVTEANFFYFADTQEMYKVADEGSYTVNGHNAYIGDTYWSQVMIDATANHKNANFMVHGGDVTHWGAVSSYWEEMFGSVEEYLFNLPLFAVPGNHCDPNYYAANYSIYEKLFNIDTPEGGANKRGLFYSFDYGPLHFVCFRDNDLFGNYTDKNNNRVSGYDEEQIEWLKTDLANARANPNTPWTVMVMHEGIITPSYSTGGESSSGVHEQDTLYQLMPVISGKVDTVLYGHNHYLDTTYPLIYEEGYNEDVGNASHNRVGLKIVTNGEGFVDYTDADNKTYQVEKYDVSNQRGTIFHQVACTGPMVNTSYKYSALADNKNTYIYYRMLASGGAGGFSGIEGINDEYDYNCYSYVEVKDGSLTVQTYAVSVYASYVENGNQAVTKDSALAGNRSVYVDGFMLTK